MNKIKNLAHEFNQTNDGITRINSGYGLKAYTQPPMNADFGFNGYSSTWNWSTAYENAGVTDLSREFSGNEIGVEIKFSGSNIADFDGQGFSILCGGCSQYINVTFDMNMSIGQGKLTTFTDNTLRKDYLIGINGATSTADLGRAIFEGIKNSGRKPWDSVYDVSGTVNGNNEILSVTIDYARHNLRIAKNPNYDGTNAEYLFVKQNSPYLLILDSGTIMATGGPGSKDDLPAPVSTEIIDGKEYLMFYVYSESASHCCILARSIWSC